jgi:hypothetical protein
MASMTQPLRPGRPKRSEFSFGEGSIPDPRTDYQSARPELTASGGVLSAAHSNDLDYGYSEDSRDAYNKHRALLRSDPTNSEEVLWPDMLYTKGNPDIYGPAPKMVQEPVYRPPLVHPQPVVRYGVTREE